MEDYRRDAAALHGVRRDPQAGSPAGPGTALPDRNERVGEGPHQQGDGVGHREPRGQAAEEERINQEQAEKVLEGEALKAEQAAAAQMLAPAPPQPNPATVPPQPGQMPEGAIAPPQANPQVPGTGAAQADPSQYEPPPPGM